MENRFYFTKNYLIISLFFAPNLCGMQHNMTTHYALMARYEKMYPNSDARAHANKMQDYKQGPVFSELHSPKALPQSNKAAKSKL